MRLWFLTYLHHAQLVEADQDGLRFKGKECRSHPPVGGRRVHSMVELESWEETCTDAAPGTPSAFPDELSTGLGAWAVYMDNRKAGWHPRRAVWGQF